MLGLPVEEFAKKFLIQEWMAGEENVKIPAPRRDFSRKTEAKREYDELLGEYNIWTEEEQRNGPRFVVASWGHNLMDGYACIFLSDENLCLIHSSKPKECREIFGCKPVKFNRHTLVDYWRKHKRWIKNLGDGRG